MPGLDISSPKDTIVTHSLCRVRVLETRPLSYRDVITRGDISMTEAQTFI
jgi:hypothetical protein